MYASVSLSEIELHLQLFSHVKCCCAFLKILSYTFMQVVNLTGNKSSNSAADQAVCIFLFLKLHFCKQKIQTQNDGNYYSFAIGAVIVTNWLKSGGQKKTVKIGCGMDVQPNPSYAKDLLPQHFFGAQTQLIYILSSSCNIPLNFLKHFSLRSVF